MKKGLTIAGRFYGPGETALIRGRCEALDDLAEFLDQWFDPSPTVELQSSGSTGAPKLMQAEKKRMEASARLTCSFLGLKAGDRALLCMPLKYIGAKMMVVRSLLWALDLYCVTASSHPLRGLAFAPGFVALTPAQVHSTLENKAEAALLAQCGQVLIGGGAIDSALAERLRCFPNRLWSSYGMTETLSHIALRPLNGPQASDWYSPFSGIELRLNAEGALIIKAPELCGQELTTNDLAELRADGKFRILGRRDNVINSGGIKIQLEAVEAQLEPRLPGPFQITSLPDPRYGEFVVLLVCPGPAGELSEAELSSAFSVLDKYARPKFVFWLPQLPRTGSGKPDRAEAKRLAQKLSEEKR